MASLSVLFRDLLEDEPLLPRSPLAGETGECGELQGSARPAGRNDAGEQVAKVGELTDSARRDSPLFATSSPPKNQPESEERRGFSPDSPDSPPSPLPFNSPRDDANLLSRTSEEHNLFARRRDRLMRWGWQQPDAEALADRLFERDREEDDRTLCVECHHWRPGRCGNSVRAGVLVPSLSAQLADLLQRCPGFKREVQ